MPIPKLSPSLVTLVGGLLFSKGGRRVAGRHAGKLALATLAFQLWEARRDRRAAAPTQAQSQHPGAKPKTHPRQRWSGRRG
ncbi:cysteine protease [Brevundimonas sp.]